MQEGAMVWGVLYLGMLVGVLLMVGLLGFFLQRKDRGR
jgi:hypothetical protein